MPAEEAVLQKMQAVLSNRLSELPIGDPVLAHAWLRSLEAVGRLAGMTDSAEVRQVTDLFMASAGVRGFAWAAEVVWPRDLAALHFRDIRRQLEEDLANKQLSLLACQAELVAMRQATGETVREFAARLRHASAELPRRQRDCGCCDRCAGDLTLAALIGGLRRPRDKDQLMERVKLAGYPVSLASVLRCIEDYDDVEGNDEEEEEVEDDGVSSSANDAKPTSPAGLSRWWRRYNRQQQNQQQHQQHQQQHQHQQHQQHEQQHQQQHQLKTPGTPAATAKLVDSEELPVLPAQGAADLQQWQQLLLETAGDKRGAATDATTASAAVATGSQQGSARRKRGRRLAASLSQRGSVLSTVDGDAEAVAAAAAVGKSDLRDTNEECLPPLI